MLFRNQNCTINRSVYRISDVATLHSVFSLCLDVEATFLMTYDKDIEAINKKVEGITSAETMKKYDVHRPFHELPDMPFASYEELEEALEKNEALLSVNYLRLSSTVLDLVSTKNELRIFNVVLWAPWLVSFLMVGLAILLQNYFLLIALLWLPIANLFSSVYINTPLYPFRGRYIVYLASIIGIVSLFVSYYTVSLLAFAYSIMHLSHGFARRVYGEVLTKRALKSELIFRFLYTGEHLSILRNA